MPYADPERMRQWRRQNAAKQREYKLRNEAKDPEKVRALRSATHRRYRERNAQKIRDRERQWRESNPERRWAKSIRHAHGMTGEQWWAMWDQQEGKCYLCGADLKDRSLTHVDHDHACCRKGRSCGYCRRGLACASCNTAIGLLRDDPELMRRVAANLEAVVGPTRDRIAMKPHQAELIEL